MLLLSEHGRRGGCWPAGLSGFKWYQNKCREFLVAFWEMSSLYCLSDERSLRAAYLTSLGAVKVSLPDYICYFLQ